MDEQMLQAVYVPKPKAKEEHLHELRKQLEKQHAAERYEREAVDAIMEMQKEVDFGDDFQRLVNEVWGREGDSNG